MFSPEDRQDEISAFVELAKKFIWAPPDIRQRIQQAGVNIVRSNFYSTVPGIDEIATSFEGGEPPGLSERN